MKASVDSEEDPCLAAVCELQEESGITSAVLSRSLGEFEVCPPENNVLAAPIVVLIVRTQVLIDRTIVQVYRPVRVLPGFATDPGPALV